jgi:hypothetical protein
MMRRPPDGRCRKVHDDAQCDELLTIAHAALHSENSPPVVQTLMKKTKEEDEGDMHSPRNYDPLAMGGAHQRAMPGARPSTRPLVPVGAATRADAT